MRPLTKFSPPTSPTPSCSPPSPPSPFPTKGHLLPPPSLHRPRHFLHSCSTTRVVIPLPLLALLLLVLLPIAFVIVARAPFPSSNSWLSAPHIDLAIPPSSNLSENLQKPPPRPQPQNSQSQLSDHKSPAAEDQFPPSTRSTPLDPASRILLFTDMWERMINVQQSLAALLIHAFERNFTFVEPFMYESHVINDYSLPELFQQQGLSPQPASLYFDLSDLFDEGRFITHDTFRERVKVPSSSPDTFVVNAGVWVLWGGKKEIHTERPYFWCDEMFDELQWKWGESDYGRAIIPTFHVQRLLCLNPFHHLLHESDKKASSNAYFDDLFAFVNVGTKVVPRACSDCVSMMFLNYRKHLFHDMPPTDKQEALIRTKYPSILVGKKPQKIARAVVRESLEGKKYVGIQFRTGKAFTLLRKYAVHKNSNDAPARFEKWLRTCSESLVREAKLLAKKLGEDGEVGFYLASDMMNSGWKGGDYGPPEIDEMLNNSLRYFKGELKDLAWLEPEKFSVEQDVMGISAAIDAGVMYFADAFVHALPSSFGMWVGHQRKWHGKTEAVVIDCLIPEFEKTQELLQKRILQGV